MNEHEKMGEAQFIHTPTSYQGPKVPPDGTLIENDDGGITEWSGGLGWRMSWADFARRQEAAIRARCELEEAA